MIHFTRHAREKFKILEQHGFNISRNDVARAVTVLRVVFREEDDRKIIITFYPGRKMQYER